MSLEDHIRTSIDGWRHPSWWRALIVLPWLLGIVLHLHDWQVNRGAATRQKSVRGKIIGHDSDNHSRYSYTFIINGQTYRGWHVPTGNEAWVLGQSVIVYYDAADPNTNALSEFSLRSLQSLGPVPFMLGGVVAVVLLIFMLRRFATPPPKADPNHG